jgi:Acetyltransferase (GNAT) domain
VKETVNAAETAVGFYQKIGFRESGVRFFRKGIWGTPIEVFRHVTSFFQPPSADEGFSVEVVKR